MHDGDEVKGTDGAPTEAPVTPATEEGNYEGVSGGDTSPPSGAPDVADDDAEREDGD